MPSFFEFNQGNETGARLGSDAAPLLGRFRAVPDENRLRQKQSVGDLFSNFGSVGYGSIWRTRSATSATDQETDGGWNVDGEGNASLKAWSRAIRDIWIKPQRFAVGRVLDRWWLRWLLVVGLPALIVSCAYVERS